MASWEDYSESMSYIRPVSFTSYEGEICDCSNNASNGSVARCFGLQLRDHPALASIFSWCNVSRESLFFEERLVALQSLEGCVRNGSTASSTPGLLVDLWNGHSWTQPSTATGAAGYVGIALALLSLLRLGWHSRGRILGLARSLHEEAVSPTFKGKILDAKTEQMRVFVQACCYMLIPVTAWSPWWELADASMRSSVSSRGVIVAAVQIFLATLAMWPGAISPRSLDAVYCILALFGALVAFPFSEGGDTISLLVLVNCLMMALTAVRRTTFTRLPLLLLVNLLFGFSSCFLISTEYVIFGSSVPYIAGAQALLVLLMTIAAPVLERKSRSLLYQLLELEELQELFSASQCLLRSCFDVVVELDAAGCVVGPGRELGALLLREQAMEGAKFAELLEGSDVQASFAERLQSGNMQAVGLAEHMQASLKDSCGNCLEMELMWFTFTRSREKHRMLGLRELPSGEVPLQEAATAERVTMLMGQNDSRISSIDVSLSETSSVPETHSVSSGSAVEAGATVVVDALRRGFPVLRLSASFRARVGPLRVGRAITSALKRPQRFERWLVLSLTSQADHHDCRVTFNMPQGDVAAHCRLLKGSQEGEANLLFYGIRARSATANEGHVKATSSAGSGLRRASRQQLAVMAL